MTSKRKTNFKPYDPDQGMLLPPYLEDLVPKGHLVRVVNRVLNSVQVDHLFDRFSDLGRSSYHPQMMLKAIVYAYSQKIYSGRRIAQALRQDINFMYLTGRQTPSYRSVNRFRGVYLKDMLEDVFTQVVDLLHKEGYIKFEEYFVDGTMIEADANKYSHVWTKNTDRYKKAVKDRVRSLFEDIERVNREEDERYGDHDLEEMGENSNVTSEKIKEVGERINKKLAEKREKKSNPSDRKMQSLVKKLDKEAENLAKYEEQEKIADGRKSFSKTDTDATFNRMKDNSLKPSYNYQVSCENQFITNFSVHQNAADSFNFPDHLQKIVNRGEEYLPKNFVGDMGYGTEENFSLLEKQKIESYLKYPGFFRETKDEYKNNLFVREHMDYDPEGDFYICPRGKRLFFQEERTTKNKHGYESTTRTYVCEDCSNCSFREQCTRSKEKSRVITVNRKLDAYRDETRKNLNSEKGIGLRKRRGYEIETFFGDAKHNQGYRRARLRGLEKTNLDLGWLCISYNLRKLHKKELMMN
jgi:transposase